MNNFQRQHPTKTPIGTIIKVHQHLDERRIRAITMYGTAGLSRGLSVAHRYKPLSLSSV